MTDLGAGRLGGPQFVCVICAKSANKDWWDRDGIPPVCRHCETHQTPTPAPKGAFKDRRINRQLFAVMQALDSEARHQFYKENGYGPQRL